MRRATWDPVRPGAPGVGGRGDPHLAYRRAAELLRPGGHPAIVATEHSSPTVHRYVWSQESTAEEYLALMSTYSGHIAASPQQRQALFAGLGA